MKNALKSVVLIGSSLSLLWACNTLAVASNGASPPATTQQFRWKVLLTGNVFQVKQTGLPLTPEAIRELKIGAFTVAGTAIRRAPGTPDLATRLAEQRTKNALAAAQRKKEALARYQAQVDAQKSRVPTPKPTPFKTKAESPAYQVSYLPQGEFALDVPAGQTVPGTVSMDIEGFAQPVVVPLVRQGNKAVVATASQDTKGNTQVSGRLNAAKTTSPVFQLRYPDNAEPVLDMIQPNGQKSTWKLDTLSQPVSEDPFGSHADSESTNADAEFNQAWSQLDQAFQSTEPASGSSGSSSTGDSGTDSGSDSNSDSGSAGSFEGGFGSGDSF